MLQPEAIRLFSISPSSLMRLRPSLVAALFSATLPFCAVAATGDTAVGSSSAATEASSSSVEAGFGTVIVEQSSPNGTFGTWTLLQGSAEGTNGKGESTTLTNIPSGRYTILVTPPNGASTAVRVYEGSSQLLYLPYQQASFTLNPGQTLRITVNYQFTRLGSISVNSDPGGIPFTLSGPNDIVIEGTTPASYQSQPEGQYKVKYHPPGGCGDPPPKGDVLMSNGRVSFTMTLSCKAADALRSRQESQPGGGKFVTVTVEGTSVTLRDVPTDAWFAVYVSAVTKAGIMSGYRDATGNPSGEFGPGNSVTVAELARIAHNASGLTEIPGVRSSNPRAQEGWFASIVASAEERGWNLYADGTVDPTRPATRAEVLLTLLQALDVPLQWQKGNVFGDVTVKTPHAAAIETAARADVVSGKDDGTGRKIFSPTEPVNRAELAKIVTDMQSKFRAKMSSSASSR